VWHAQRLLRGSLALLASAFIVALAAAWADRASRRVPPFYQRALAVRPGDQKLASQELEVRAVALYNDLRKEGRWHALFTAEQINAWLAVQLAEQYPEMALSEIGEPRVSISPDSLIVAFRWNRPGRSTVVSVHVDLAVTDRHSLACRLKKARAGALPIPLKGALDEVTRTSQRMDLPLRWMHANGDPVAVVAISPEDSAEEQRICLDTLKLLDGAIYLAGRSLPRVESRNGDEDVAPDQRGEKANLHR
jgi:hypothetical protein